MSGHPFIEKMMFITQSAVPSARSLGLVSKCILATCRACPTKIFLDSYRVFLEHTKIEDTKERLCCHTRKSS